MIRIESLPFYRTEILRDSENNVISDGDGNVLTEQILVYTIEEHYDDIISDEDTLLHSNLLLKKRIMPDGDVYIINGNVEEYIPAIKVESIKPLSDFAKMMDVIQWVIEYGGLPTI